MAASECHVLLISEVQEMVATSRGQRAWMVELALDDDQESRKIMPIDDPIPKNEHALCRRYLNYEHLKEPQQLSRADANRQEKAIDQYGRALFDQLGFSQLRLKNSTLKILVAERSGGVTLGSTYTIHCLYWESLESLDLWEATSLTVVTVRRSVNLENDHRVLARSKTWRYTGHGVHTINVLLIIARRFGEKVLKETPPSQVQNAILRVRALLEDRRGPYQISLEIVRPGTYRALEQYLAPRKGYFNLVHFDVHGLIEDKGAQAPLAKLRFIHKDGPEKFHDVPGQVIAKLLVKHGIYCVVVNACDSGRAMDGFDANLSRVFVQEGVSNVLAMSSHFTTSAALQFHQSLYEALFVQQIPFSDAARVGRKALRDNPKRRGHEHVIADMKDWIIPVVYSHHLAKDICIERAVMEDSFSTSVSTLNAVPSYNTSRHMKLIAGGPQCDMEEYMELDFDILRFEADLISERLVYFYGARLMQKTRLMRCLSHYWCLTGLLDHVYHVQSSWFLSDLTYSETFRHRFLDGDMLHRIPMPSPKVDESFWKPRTMVIIDQIDDLFEDMADSAQERGRQRLFGYLEKVAQRDEKVRLYLPRVFIVIISRKNDQDWWDVHFRNDRPLLTGPLFYRQRGPTFIEK